MNKTTSYSFDEIGEIKLSNIINIGLRFSDMLRVFKKGSKNIIYQQAQSTLGQLFKTECQEEFNQIHSEFCKWGIQEISLAKKNANHDSMASYGQVAKMLNVLLKVAVYYCHLPNYEKAICLLPLLDAAVDNDMMSLLKNHYPNALKRWPKTVYEVKEKEYLIIRDIVYKFIGDKHQNSILPVHFDDIYFRKPEGF